MNNNLWQKLFRERPFLGKSVAALQPASIKRRCHLLSCHTNTRNTTASTQAMMQQVIPLDLFKSAGTYFLNYWSQRNCLIRKGGTGNQLTFRHRASSIKDRSFATLQRKFFMYLINKCISLSDICLTVHH